MIAPEEWKPVPAYEDLYEVSSHGRVLSHHRETPRFLRPGNHGAGYRLVVLCKDGKQTSRTVHSLMLEAFIGPRPEGMEARHLDGNPANNLWAPGDTEEEVRANGGNLIYGTGRQNNLDQVAHGTHNNASKEKCAQDHEYTEENTFYVYNPDGSVKQRGCRQCRDAKGARFRALEGQPPASDEERCTDPEGCDRRKVAKGLCRKHYARAWRAGREQRDAA